MKPFKKVGLFLGMMMLGSLFCGEVWGQSEEITVLETVIVTDSGQKSNLLDTNASIHVIAAKDIKNSGQSSTAELISSIPGVINQKSGSQTYFSVRGTRSTMSGGPKIYMDGRPINVGVYGYSDFEQDRVYPYDTAGNNASSEADADIDAQKKLFGISLNHEFCWDIFRLQSGLRYNNVSYDLSNRVPQSVSVTYDNDIDWSISPSVSVMDNANLFVTWNHSKYYLPLGYYSGNMSYDNDATRPEDLDPETYDTVETGWKHQMGKAFNYSLILYYTRIDDSIVSYYEGTSFKGRRNAGTSIHKGVEAEMDGRPLDWLGYRVSVTTIDAEWDN